MFIKKFLEKVTKCSEPVKMYKVEYDPNDDCYWGYRRVAHTHIAPFVKVRNTFSADFDCSLQRLQTVIANTEKAKSVEF